MIANCTPLGATAVIQEWFLDHAYCGDADPLEVAYDILTIWEKDRVLGAAMFEQELEDWANPTFPEVEALIASIDETAYT